MKAVQVLGAVGAWVASILLSRIALHGFTDHGHLDLFHLVVAALSASLGLLLLRRAFRHRRA